MRIRRRPQSFSSQPSSDPSTSSAPQPQPKAARNQECLVGGDKEEEKLHLHPNVDLGGKSSVVKRLALPQDNVVDCSKILQGAKQKPSDSHRSLENGHHVKSETAVKAEEHLVNGGVAVPVAAVTAATKEEKNDSGGSGGAGIKKRRSPAVLMEGSRCSRVNGRGWRCSQPTLVGYSLCEHHLGKGRMRSVSGGRSGTGQLGRTEPRKHAAAVPAVTPAPKVEEPGLRHC